MLHEEYPALPQAEPLVKDSFAQTAIPFNQQSEFVCDLRND